jgi:hypothetical protein
VHIDNSDASSDQERITLYVNTECDNEVTLGGTMEADIDSFGDVTWREFIEDYLYEDISSYQDCLDEWLETEYGISAKQLEVKLDAKAIDRYYDALSLHQDNSSGGNAEAFDLIWSLKLFPMDPDGNGSAHGVELVQSTANGPRKTVWITDPAAADWLVEQAAERGVRLEVLFT